MALSKSELGDTAGKFDISDSEVERIASMAVSEENFEYIWENCDWWTDEQAALEAEFS